MSVQVNSFQFLMCKSSFIITLASSAVPAGRGGPAKHSQPFSSEREQLSEIKSNETPAEINSNYALEGGGGDSAPADPSQIIVEETSRSFQSAKCAHSFSPLLSTWMRSYFAEPLNKTRMCLENNKKNQGKRVAVPAAPRGSDSKRKVFLF